MSEIFLHIINRSISASYIVLAVLLLRLLLKKAPKWITVLLWGIVGVRLICPFSFESVFILIPSAETVSPDIMTDQTPALHTGILILDKTLNPRIRASFAPAPEADANPLQIWIPVLAVIWLVGTVALLVYTVVSYVRVTRKIGTAVWQRDNIYQSEKLRSPFVLGLIKPKIYLPFSVNEQDVAHVVAHEQAHIRRKDHLWKPLGFLLLSVYWFNPLMWLGYHMLCRDIEFACDEKVIKKLGNDARADYSEALLACSINRRRMTACPLAFGEVGVKDRIKNVLNYKKPAFWIVIVALVTSLVVAVCFLTNPIPINKDHIGVQSISIAKRNADVFELRIKYSYPSGSYVVRSVPEKEGEYCGDGMVDYDGSLGKFRMMIAFPDTDTSKTFAEKYPPGEVVELENAPIRIRLKCVSPSDHGFVLYVGFDENVYVDEVDGKKLNELGGTIKIPIRMSDKSLP